jgi:hypothetical protein
MAKVTHWIVTEGYEGSLRKQFGRLLTESLKDGSMASLLRDYGYRLEAIKQRKKSKVQSHQPTQ